MIGEGSKCPTCDATKRVPRAARSWGLYGRDDTRLWCDDAWHDDASGINPMSAGKSMAYKRRCHRCLHNHFFVALEDDRDECPKCGGDLDPHGGLQCVVTEVEVEAAIVQDELSVLIEKMLGDEALTIWERIDNHPHGDVIVTDIAGQIAARIVDNLRPTVALVSAARAFARAKKAYNVACATPTDERRQMVSSASSETTSRLHHAAHALEYGCRQCGKTLVDDGVLLDERRLCPSCAAGGAAKYAAAKAEAEFDARCREALAAFKESPGRFAEAIVAERPLITMVEFVERATRAEKIDDHQD